MSYLRCGSLAPSRDTTVDQINHCASLLGRADNRVGPSGRADNRASSSGRTPSSVRCNAANSPPAGWQNNAASSQRVCCRVLLLPGGKTVPPNKDVFQPCLKRKLVSLLGPKNNQGFSLAMNAGRHNLRLTAPTPTLDSHDDDLVHTIVVQVTSMFTIVLK